MDKYEENLLRLNQKIRALMTQIDTLDTKNRKLQHENGVLVEDVANFRVQYAMAEEGRLQCKSVLEKEMARNSEQYESHQLLKRRYNDLIKEYVGQNQKLKSYEVVSKEDDVKQSRANRKHVPVEIIGKLSDIGKPTALEDKVSTLEKRCASLEKELRKAYAVIDDLEFELESIDHLEETNERLEGQIRDLKAELERWRLCAPPTPNSATSVASPAYGGPIYTFESFGDAKQSLQQDDSKEQKSGPLEEKPNDVIRESNHVTEVNVLESYQYDSIEPASKMADNEMQEKSLL